MTHDEDEETVEIVYGTRRSPDDPRVLEEQTKEVPKRWYEELRHADGVFQRVGEKWIQRDGVTGVGLSPGTYDGDSGDEAEIVVTVDQRTENAQSVEAGIPESVDGIQVRIEHSDSRESELL